MAPAAPRLCTPQVYLQHRHKAATANRLLRFVSLLFMCFGNTPSNQAALASSLRLTPEGSGKSEAVVAMLNMYRPLFLTGLIVQGGVSTPTAGRGILLSAAVHMRPPVKGLVTLLTLACVVHNLCCCLKG